MSVSSRFASSLRAHPLAGFVSALAAGAVLGGTAMHMLAQKMHGRCPVVEGGQNTHTHTHTHTGHGAGCIGSEASGVGIGDFLLE
jgi:hypothetical protein